jgi:hypothetical protein
MGKPMTRNCLAITVFNVMENQKLRSDVSVACLHVDRTVGQCTSFGAQISSKNILCDLAYVLFILQMQI